ncbi:unnamed protein product [Dimorphilus gyrociliatus]|uniref:LRRCT domain-containing protein n=1 Tax=Dimorphilus gyrociliatus TaxID=2664684 RepID=A0A7I8W4E9_9ANNE|nr:unnamed protein product [Dimorphilus gyrociliatus]
MFLHRITILLLISWTSVALNCPESLDDVRCSCENEKNLLKIYCRDWDKRIVFPVFDKEVRKSTFLLNLADNRITSVARENLSYFFKLTQLDISNNRISLLSTNLLSACIVLERLNLSGNLISERSLSQKVFLQNKNLKILDLSRNKLSGILSYNNFAGLDKLDTLILEHNDIRGFQANTFKDMVNLKHLRLNENRLDILDTYFQPLKSLVALELQFCSIKRIRPMAFNQSIELATLDLSKNRLEEVPIKSLKFLRHLTVLLLNKNNFTTIPSYSFTFLGRLQELRLSHMQHLKSVQDYAFDGLHSIIELHMSNNPKLSYISNKAFQEMATPKVLSLHSNNLTTIGNDALRWYGISVKELYMNPWNCNCSLRFLIHLLKRNKGKPDEKIICQTPANLKDKAVINLRDPEVCQSIDQSSLASSNNTTSDNSQVWIIAPICSIVAVVIIVIVIGIFIWKKRNKDKGYQRTQQAKEFDDFSDKSRSHYSITEDDDGFAWDDTTTGNWVPRTAETKNTGSLINA